MALVGYGLAGSVFHAPLIAATEGLALDTVVTRNPERREQARGEFPDVRFTDAPDELWERAGELDLVVVASPNRTHVPVATAALEAGLAVVVDKPVTGTAAEARALAALADERGLFLSVFQNRRWDNDFLTLRRLLAEGELGDVRRFESRFERWRPELKGGWRESGDPAEIGGLLYDLGSGARGGQGRGGRTAYLPTALLTGHHLISRSLSDNGSTVSPMRPDTSAENVDHHAEAARLERTAGLHPEDAEHLLLQAAAHLELAGSRPAATALYDRLLSSPASLENPHLVRALKASNLWEYGHEAEARAIIEGLRAASPRAPAPWVIAAEALESHDELEAAHETFTEGATALLSGVTDPPRPTHPLLFGRHRVRRMLGAAHDDWDALADTLHSSSISLDELHDPKRVWSLGSNNPAELEAEISRLRAELGAYREDLSRPFPVAVLHWPAQELAELVAAYPTLAEEYPSHEEHLGTIEASLRELAASGTANLGVVPGTVPSYEAFAASEGASPADATLLPQYATTLAARGRAEAWPPQWGTGCWCGSGRVYEGCHGTPD